MGKNGDYIPHGDGEFNPWLKFIVRYSTEKCSGTSPEWTHIPKTALETLSAAYADWYSAYSLYLEPHAPPVTAAKNDAKREAMKIIRLFVAQYLMFPPVTDADRAAMRVPVHATGRTPIEPPEKPPVFIVRPYAACILEIDFWPEGSTGKAKPYGCEGAVVNYAVLDEPPSGPEALVGHKMATRTPYRIQFRESDRGKKVYIALYWQARKGRQSPWSLIQVAVVP